MLHILGYIRGPVRAAAPPAYRHIRDNSILGHICYNRHINIDIEHIRTY